jgi:hypothetical protein
MFKLWLRWTLLNSCAHNDRVRNSKHVSYSVGFEILTAELMKIKYIWYFTPRRLVNSYRRFGGA